MSCARRCELDARSFCLRAEPWRERRSRPSRGGLVRTTSCALSARRRADGRIQGNRSARARAHAARASTRRLSGSTGAHPNPNAPTRRRSKPRAAPPTLWCAAARRVALELVPPRICLDACRGRREANTSRCAHRSARDARFALFASESRTKHVRNGPPGCGRLPFAPRAPPPPRYSGHRRCWCEKRASSPLKKCFGYRTRPVASDLGARPELNQWIQRGSRDDELAQSGRVRCRMTFSTGC
jgi:hypothetical protein